MYKCSETWRDRVINMTIFRKRFMYLYSYFSFSVYKEYLLKLYQIPLWDKSFSTSNWGVRGYTRREWPKEGLLPDTFPPVLIKISTLCGGPGLLFQIVVPTTV